MEFKIGDTLCLCERNGTNYPVVIISKTTNKFGNIEYNINRRNLHILYDKELKHFALVRVQGPWVDTYDIEINPRIRNYNNIEYYFDNVSNYYFPIELAETIKYQYEPENICKRS